MATARLYNLARMDTATTGTGTVTLGSAVTGFLTFTQAGVTDGATVTYAIKDGNNSEIGRGVYTSSGTTLTRATILNSTNSNNALNLSGSAEVFITPASLDFVPAVNPQTGTTYTVLATDLGKLVTHSNASSIAVTLPQATGLFTTGFYYYARNLGAGAVTITPTTSTIDGASTLVLRTGEGALIFSDGTNYQTVTALTPYGSRVDVASAATTDIGAAASNFVRITGTTTITSLGTASAGIWRDVVFDGSLTLTHNATSLILPGQANIVTVQNDRMRCRSLGSGNWIVLEYVPAAGNLTRGTSVSASGTAVDFTGIPSGVKRITVMFSNVSLSGTDDLLVQIGDSGGIETTGYVSGSFNSVNSTTGYIIRLGNAARTAYGAMQLCNLTGNNWISWHATNGGTQVDPVGGGGKTLSDTLDRVRITTTGTNTFDSGVINILWEG